MKFLVTGGAGFIGSALVNELLKQGEVIVLDNLSTGKKSNVSQKATFIRGDIREESDVAKAISGCGAVFHLAAQTEVARSVENPEVDYQINVTGSQIVFSAARSAGAKIIFTSSAAVYGDTAFASESSECKPISEYGKNKLFAERLLKKDNAFIARCFNCYGPGGNSVINKFCANTKRGMLLTIFGNGLQTRDFIYIDDLVAALLLGLKKSGTYNIGSGTETTVNQIVDIIKMMSEKTIRGKAPKVSNAEERAGEIKHSCADLSKIARLGWSPKISVQEGIKRVWESAKFSS
ncbi:MAG: NAD-dependent epimerase/dehydratase family protein [Candidatus Aenigmarchaeota archaeon]|nr:NAD-dependent epimerase/dehydratase family protein [Candidatus Aenigmarchaeota archaeon]